MKIKKSEYRCFYSRKSEVLAMERLTALINMGRKYLSDTYGVEESFYKITSFSYGKKGCSVDFLSEYKGFRYQFDYIHKTNTVIFALFTMTGLEGEVEIGQLEVD